MGNIKVNSDVTVLWAGIIFDICRLYIYVDNRFSDKLYYTFQEDLSIKLSPTANPLVMHLSVSAKGVVLISSKNEDTAAIEKSITTVIDEFKNLYIANTLKVYKKEYNNELRH